jgi:hypothetical protein
MRSDALALVPGGRRQGPLRQEAPSRRARTSCCTEPAGGRLSWWWDGTDGAPWGRPGFVDIRQDGTRGQRARSAACELDAIQRGADAGRACALGREARVAKPRQDAIQRGPVRFDGAEAGRACALGWEARAAELRQDAIRRGTVRFDGADAGRGCALGRKARVAELRQDAQFENLGNDPMDGRAEQRVGRGLRADGRVGARP